MVREENEVASKSRARAALDAARQSEELLTLRLRGLISDAEFSQRKERLGRDQDSLLLESRRAEELLKSDEAIDRAERVASLCVTGPMRFADAVAIHDPDAREAVAREVGSRYVLTRGKIVVEPNKLLSVVTGLVRAVEKKEQSVIAPLEPLRIRYGSIKKGHTKALCTTWGSLRDGIRTKVTGVDDHLDEPYRPTREELAALVRHAARRYDAFLFAERLVMPSYPSLTRYIGLYAALIECATREEAGLPCVPIFQP